MSTSEKSLLQGSSVEVPERILDPGLCLTLRPMRYPEFYEMYRDGIKNTWTVDEIDFQTDLIDLKQKLTPAEVHLIRRQHRFQ
jgi:ribonucleoside-diphosphate reductase beta chain